jgi:hypothetical protein
MDAAQFDAILADVAAGEAAYKAMQAHSVPRKAFYAHIAVDEQAGNKYARAKQSGMEVLADEIIEISDNSMGDWFDDKLNPEVVARARLRVDSRKWLLSKLVPKKYGDKVDLTHAGPGGGPIVQRVENVIIDAAG